MSKITYTNKVALYENNDIADINKVNASDMNEIKACVNNNDDMLTGGAVAGNMVVESIRTKNMFDTESVVPATSGTNTDIQGTNSVTIKQITKNSVVFTTSANWNGFAGDYIAVKKNTQYTASVQVSWVNEVYIRIFCYNTSKTLIADYSKSRNTSLTITTPANTKYVRVLIERITASSTELTCSNIQLEEGSNATDYSEYQALNITQKEYSLTPIYTSSTPIYKLRRYGNMCVLEVNAIYFSSITANNWVSIASIPSEIIPPYSIGGALIQANSSNGNIEGYGRVELQNNGNIRVKTTSTSNAPFFTFTLLWFI